MIHLRLFGAVGVRAGDDTDASSILAQPKRAALLAILALAEEGVVRRDRLVGLLWPELTEARARNALSKAIHHIRRTLGERSVESGPGDEVRLVREEWSCDAWSFLESVERGDHEAALSRINGSEILESFHLPEAPEWGHWVDVQQARFRRMAVESALYLVAASESGDDLDGAVRWLRRAHALTPFDEAVFRRLLTALARSGDRGGALDEYARFAARLRSALEVDPAPETDALAEAIRREEALGRSPSPPPELFLRPAGASPAPGEGRDAGGPEELPAPRPPAPLAPPPAASSRGVGGRRWAAAAMALAALVAVWASLRPSGSAEARPTRVVVVPFERAADDPGPEAWGAVAADWISLVLSRTAVVEVVPARAVYRELDHPGAADASTEDSSLATARRLGADLLVTGRYATVGDTLVVYPWVLDPGSGAVVRALDPLRGSMDNPTEVLVELRARVAGVMAALVDPRIAVAATSATRPPKYEAYAEYVSGLEPWRRDQPREAARRFERAYGLDSTFVSILPWLWESLVLSGRGAEAAEIFGVIQSRRDELDAYDLAAVAWMRGFQSGDREGALLAGRRMAELAPTSQDANWSHAWAAVNTNRFREALDAFARVEAGEGWMEDWAFYVHWPTLAHHLLGDHRGELALARRFRERYPDDHRPCAYEVRARAALGQADSVRATLDRCLTLADGMGQEWVALLLHAAAELRAHGNAAAALPLADTAAVLADAGARAEPGAIPWRRMRLDALAQAGRWREVIQAVEADPEPHLRLFYRMEAAGMAAAELGDTAGARAALERMPEGIETPGDSARFFLRQAGVLARLGGRDRAVEALRGAVRKGLSPAEVFHAQLALEPLAEYPPFEALIAPRSR